MNILCVMKIVDVMMASLAGLPSCEVPRGELMVLMALASLQVADVERLRRVGCVRCGLGGRSLHVLLSRLRAEGFIRAIGARPCGWALTSRGEGVVRRYVVCVQGLCVD